jgi:tRNA(Ile)-lysidine synthase
MRERDGRWVRPLLGVGRATTEQACAALGLPVWHDPANDDPAFERVRLRHEALPLLDDILQGGVAEALARTAALLRDDLDALDADAAAVIDTAVSPENRGDGRVDHVLDVAAVAALPRAVRTRVLRLWAARVGAAGPLSAERTGALDALLTDWHGQGPVDLPGAIAVRRASGRLVACPNSTPTSTKS